jgi:N12 class adenine-specific DNA methylase
MAYPRVESRGEMYGQYTPNVSDFNEEESAAYFNHTNRDGRQGRARAQSGGTLAARDKQKGIKERFRTWIFADPDRTERLVRFYN